MTNSAQVQVAMLGESGLTSPWESLHVEALARFDHWLKGRDAGILNGSSIRHALPAAGWRTADTWPPTASTLRQLALRGWQ